MTYVFSQNKNVELLFFTILELVINRSVISLIRYLYVMV